MNNGQYHIAVVAAQSRGSGLQGDKTGRQIDAAVMDMAALLLTG